MKTYATIKAQIAKLEKQAESFRKAEIAGVVSRIKEAIKAYALTAADLGFGGGKSKAAPDGKTRRAKKSATTVGVAKYRDPKSGKTWTGRGKPPNWIVGVKNRDEYLIDKPREAGAKPKAARGGRASGRGRKTAAAPTKTPAVRIESGAASE
jgi:DNA-binding protein H-NS